MSLPRAVCHTLFSFSFVAVGLVLAGCTTHQQQANQAALQQCLTTQEVQGKQQVEQQQQVMAQLDALKAQLDTQQKLLEARPQIIEKPVTRIICPASVAAPAPKVPPQETPAMDKQIVGLREQALLPGLDVLMPARINTNVANSMLDARNIQMFERNGEEWVRFTIYNPETKEPHVLERKRLRFQNVTTAAATSEKRPVVEMRFTLGKLTQKGEFILADRSDSEFPMLIGRNILRDVMLVDVSGDNLAPVQRVDDPAPAKH